MVAAEGEDQEPAVLHRKPAVVLHCLKGSKHSATEAATAVNVQTIVTFDGLGLPLQLC